MMFCLAIRITGNSSVINVSNVAYLVLNNLWYCARLFLRFATMLKAINKMANISTLGRLSATQVFKTSIVERTVQKMCSRCLYHVSRNQVQSPRTVSSTYDRYVFPEPPSMISDNEHDEVIEKVNEIIHNPGRLFAVVTVSGHQYKVTQGDIIRVTGLMPAECGEQIRLEKVCLVGGRDFTLLGKPVLPRKVTCINATIIEKTLGEDIIIKRFKRRKRYERTQRINSLYSLLRINDIQVTGDLS